jgi:hypothetical protein
MYTSHVIRLLQITRSLGPMLGRPLNKQLLFVGQPRATVHILDPRPVIMTLINICREVPSYDFCIFVTTTTRYSSRLKSFWTTLFISLNCQHVNNSGQSLLLSCRTSNSG